MFPPITIQWLPREERWLGQFTPGISLVIVGRLQRDGILIDPLLSWQCIRVIGLRGKEWYIDPLMEQAQEWRLWIWERRTLVEVDWDPGEC